MHTFHMPRKLKNSKFFYLFVSLVLLFVLVPFLEIGPITLIILKALVSLVLLAGIYAVGYRQHHMKVALILGLPPFIMNLVALFSSTAPVIVPTIVMNLLFYFYTTGTIFEYVLKGNKVDLDRLFGAICVYILLGLTWGALYSVVYHYSPTSFYIDPVRNVGGIVDWSDLTYFSFVTLATIGYGDITPVSSLARSLAVLEAVTGVLYIAIMIARLVGLHTSQVAERSHDRKHH